MDEIIKRIEVIEKRQKIIINIIRIINGFMVENYEIDENDEELTHLSYHNRNALIAIKLLLDELLW